MKSLKSRYNYDPSLPLSKEYQDAQVFNAYYKCFDSETNNHYLLSHFKSQNKTQVASLFKKFNNIKEKLSTTTSKHITKIHDVFLQNKDKSLFLVTDLLQGGSIMDYVGKVYTLDSQTAGKIILGALKGLMQLHKHDIVNCFINLQNIQVDQNGTPKLSFKCMIYKTIYLSPQFRKSHVKSKESDLYCLGACLYRLVYGQFPFKTQKTEELIEMVRKGPVLQMEKGQGSFPIIGSNVIREILKDLLSFQPQNRTKGVAKLQEFSKQLSPNPTLNEQVYSKLFKSKYINLLIQLNNPDESEYVVVDPKQKKLLKVLVQNGGKEDIEEYIKKVINNYAKLPGEIFLKIYEYQIFMEKHLAIVFSYCGECNLKDYRQNMESSRVFSQKQVDNSVQFLKSSLKSLSQSHQYLTNQNLYLKNGGLRIKFPQFKTKRLSQLFNKLASSSQTQFIAPQILAGKQSVNCDSWSIGVIEYWMTYNEMPKFDSKDTLLINKEQRLPKQKLLYFHNVIQKNPNNRVNALDQEQVKNKLSKNNETSFNEFLSPTSSPHNKQQQNNNLIRSKLNQIAQKDTNSKSPQTKKSRTIQSNLESPNVKSPKNKSIIKKFLPGEQEMQVIEVAAVKRSQKIKKSKLIQQQPLQQNAYNSNILPNKIQVNQPIASKYKSPIILSSQLLPQKNPNKFDMKVFEQPQQIKSPQRIETNEKQNYIVQQPSPPITEQLLEYGLHVGSRLSTLQKSYTKSIRISIKCIIAILFYFFLFYFNFFRVTGSLISSRQTYQTSTIQIRAFGTDSRPNINYTLVTKTPTQTNQLFYNKTLPLLRDQYKCVLNDYSTQSNVNRIIKSSGFVTYQVFGFLIAIFHILAICVVIARLDICKAFSLCDFDEKKYHPLMNYGLVMLAIVSLTSLHYLIYGGLYHLMLEPCLGKSSLPGLQFLMKNWVSSWLLRFVWIYIGIVIAYSVIIYFLVKPVKSLHNYIYIGLVVLYFVGVGVRGMGKSYPAYQNAFGVCGELLGMIIGICLFIVDLAFVCFTRHKPQTNTENNIDTRSIEDFNKTEEFFFPNNDGIDDQFNEK